MKGETEKDAFESVVQALGALDWTLVRIVFNVRARTAVGFQRYLANVGIETPGSIVESSKWFGAFHRAPAVPKHQQGFGGSSATDLLRSVLKGAPLRRRCGISNKRFSTCVSTYKLPLQNNCETICRQMAFTSQYQCCSQVNGEMSSPER